MLAGTSGCAVKRKLMLQNRITEGLTFDDVLLVPAYSDILPHEVSVQTRLTRHLDCNILR